jgi:hypothetical protein
MEAPMTIFGTLAAVHLVTMAFGAPPPPIIPSTPGDLAVQVFARVAGQIDVPVAEVACVADNSPGSEDTFGYRCYGIVAHPHPGRASTVMTGVLTESGNRRAIVVDDLTMLVVPGSAAPAPIPSGPHVVPVVP